MTASLCCALWTPQNRPGRHCQLLSKSGRLPSLASLASHGTASQRQRTGPIFCGCVWCAGRRWASEQVLDIGFESVEDSGQVPATGATRSSGGGCRNRSWHFIERVPAAGWAAMADPSAELGWEVSRSTMESVPARREFWPLPFSHVDHRRQVETLVALASIWLAQGTLRLGARSRCYSRAHCTWSSAISLDGPRSPSRLPHFRRCWSVDSSCQCSCYCLGATCRTLLSKHMSSVGCLLRGRGQHTPVRYGSHGEGYLRHRWVSQHIFRAASAVVGSLLVKLLGALDNGCCFFFLLKNFPSNCWAWAEHVVSEDCGVFLNWQHFGRLIPPARLLCLHSSWSWLWFWSC